MSVVVPAACGCGACTFSAVATTLTGAEQVEWNLDDLFEGPDDPRLDTDLDEASAAATAFRERYRGKLGQLTAAALAAAVAELERIE